jgi:hypothetical protein
VLMRPEPRVALSVEPNPAVESWGLVWQNEGSENPPSKDGC